MIKCINAFDLFIRLFVYLVIRLFVGQRNTLRLFWNCVLTFYCRISNVK